MHLAQMNIAKSKAPLEAPLMKEFVDNLEPINAIADQSPGFVWRLKDDSGDATSIQLFEDPLIIINMSVWESASALKDFLFKTHHLHFLQRKSEWFEKLGKESHVMWWIDPGRLPTPEEGRDRLERLWRMGDTELAFGFKSKQFLERIGPRPSIVQSQ